MSFLNTSPSTAVVRGSHETLLHELFTMPICTGCSLALQVLQAWDNARVQLSGLSRLHRVERTDLAFARKLARWLHSGEPRLRAFRALPSEINFR